VKGAYEHETCDSLDGFRDELGPGVEQGVLPKLPCFAPSGSEINTHLVRHGLVADLLSFLKMSSKPFRDVLDRHQQKGAHGVLSVRQAACCRRICRCFRAASNFRSLSAWECTRPGTPLSLEDARRLVAGYVELYNNVRLNSAVGYIAPKDMLAGRQQEIHAQRDRKLEAARKQRQIRRQQAA